MTAPSAAEHAKESRFCITTALLWRRSSSPGSSFQRPERQLPQSPHLLNLHCDRILAAAKAFMWQIVLEIFSGETGHKHFQTIMVRLVSDAIRKLNLNSDMWKVRVLVSEDGSIQVVPAPIGSHLESGISIPQWPVLPEKLYSVPLESNLSRVLIDGQPTLPSLFTTHKTTVRTHYDVVRSKLHIEHQMPAQSEVLLFNEKREITEASLCTPFFFQRGVWTTPPLSSGGNAGVSRRMALEAGLCVEEVLHIDELVDGQIIWLSNAVRGFMQGKLHLSEGR